MSTKFIISMILLLSLTACKIDSQSEIFVQDIYSVELNRAGPIMANSTIRIEMPSAQKCQEQMPRVVEIVSRYYQSVENASCMKERMDDYLAFSAKVPLMALQDKMSENSLPDGALSGFGVLKIKDSLMVFAMLSRSRLEQVSAELSRLFSSKVDIQFRNVSILLQNDSGKPIHLIGPSAFLNEKPMPIFSADVRHRDKVAIRLSDVTLAVLKQHSHSWIATLTQ